MHVDSLGWNEYFNVRFHEFHGCGYTPGRIAGQSRDRYMIWGDFGALSGEVSGRFRFETKTRSDFPVVGDWVAVRPHGDEDSATIHAVLPRRSAFSRKRVGSVTEEQILASNMDFVFVVAGLDQEFNPRRLERYVVTAWDSGAMPVIILNKADICSDLSKYRDDAQKSAPTTPVVTMSAKTGEGIDVLDQYLQPGTTGVLLGSSGVGKSSVINRLAGEERQLVTDVREGDSRGRHTTTNRELIVLPGGALIIDTPGLRELQLWADEEEVDAAFSVIGKLAEKCRFRDCRHEQEPGCAVLEAVQSGKLDEARLRNYRKMRREQRRLSTRKKLHEFQIEKQHVRKTIRSHERSINRRER